MPNSNTIDWFEIVKFVVEIILTVAAVGISVVALIQTKKQIKLSNKHQLFDRRLEKYCIFDSLLTSFSEAVLVCESESELENNSTYILEHLLDNAYLEDALWVSEKTLDDKGAKQLRKKQRWLWMISEETLIIFENDESKIMSDFIKLYGLLTFNLYEYNYWKCFEEEKDMQEKTKKEAYNYYHRLWSLYGQIEETGVDIQIKSQVMLKG